MEVIKSQKIIQDKFLEDTRTWQEEQEEPKQMVKVVDLDT